LTLLRDERLIQGMDCTIPCLDFQPNREPPGPGRKDKSHFPHFGLDDRLPIPEKHRGNVNQPRTHTDEERAIAERRSRSSNDYCSPT
jgi:hypothetical protein